MSYLEARTAWATVEKCKENLEKEPGHNSALALQVNRRIAQAISNKEREKFRVVE